MRWGNLQNLYDKEGRSKIIFTLLLSIVSISMFLWIIILLTSAIPEQATPVINMTDHPYNTTNANITAWNVSSVNATKNIYNWFVNNESLTLAYLPFENHIGDETSEVLDYSGYGNNFTVNSAIYNSTGGKDGKGAYQFDGVNTYINHSEIRYISKNYSHSISAWFKVVDASKGTNGNEANTLIANSQGGNDMVGIVVMLGEIRYGIYNGASYTYKVSGAIPQNKTWYHVVTTFNGTGASMYLNGVKQTGTNTPYLSDVYNNLIGTSGIPSLHYKFFNGSIDEVMYFNRSLSHEQVILLYRNQTNVISSFETNVSETWWVNVTPNDGIEDGVSLKSNEISIRSTPTHSTPIINATDNPFNRSTANLTAYNVSTSDADGSPVKNIYNWFVDNQSIAVLNMPFEGTGEESTLAKDYSGHNNTGVLGNVTSGTAPLWNSSGGYGGSGGYQFDGINDFIEKADNPTLNFGNFTNFTVMARYKANSLPIDSQWMVSKRYWNAPYTGYSLDLSNVGGDSRVYFTIFDDLDNAQVFAATTLNKWNHVAVSCIRATNCSLYHNGAYANFVSTIPIGNITTTLPLTIGKPQLTTLNYQFNGSIDDVMIFNRSLSAEQIRAIYLNQSNVIVQNETNADQTWWVNVTPNDGVEDGNSLKSNEITIQNTPSVTSDIQTNNTAPKINMDILLNWTVQDNDSLQYTLLQIQNSSGKYNTSLIAVSGAQDDANYTYNVWDVQGTKLNFTFFVNDTFGSISNSSTFQVNVSNTVATHSTPIINATDSPFNRSTANLTAYNQSTSDADGSPVKNIYNWFVNNESITILNLPFEGGSNDNLTQDYSGNNNSALVGNDTANSNPRWNSTGGYGGSGAYYFEGDNDQLVITDRPSLDFGNSTNFTISVRFKLDGLPPTSGQDEFAVIEKRNPNSPYNGYRIITHSAGGGRVYFVFGDTDGTTQGGFWTPITIRKWNSVAVSCVRDANCTIYKNGAYAHSTTMTGYGNISSDVNLKIGAYHVPSYTNSFNGSIDDVMIFNRSLSPSQIYALYMNQSSIITSNETQAGETWWVNVTPNDGIEDGNSLKSNEITIQNSPPLINLISPRQGERNNTNLTVFFRISDNDTTQNWTVSLYINNSINATGSYNTQGVKTLTSNLNDDGRYTYYLNITDGTDYGNTSWEFWTLDTQYPYITWRTLSTNNDSKFSQKRTNITLNEMCQDNGLLDCQIQIDRNSTRLNWYNRTQSTITNTTYNFTETVNISYWGDGYYQANLSAIDDVTESPPLNNYVGKKPKSWQTEYNDPDSGINFTMEFILLNPQLKDISLNGKNLVISVNNNEKNTEIITSFCIDSPSNGQSIQWVITKRSGPNFQMRNPNLGHFVIGREKFVTHKSDLKYVDSIQSVINPQGTQVNITLNKASWGSGTFCTGSTLTGGLNKYEEAVMFELDSYLPVIQNLTNVSFDQNWYYINWTVYDNNTNYTEIRMNGTWKVNTSDTFYNFTNLISSQTFSMSLRGIDLAGNTGDWVNQSVTTSSAPVGGEEGGGAGGDGSMGTGQPSLGRGASACDEIADKYQGCYYLDPMEGKLCLPGCESGKVCATNHRCVSAKPQPSLTERANQFGELLNEGAKSIKEFLRSKLTALDPSLRYLYVVLLILSLIGLTIAVTRNRKERRYP